MALLKSASPGAEEIGEVFVAIGRQVLHGFGLAVELDRSGVGDVETGAVKAHVGAEQPGEKRMLFGWIAADKQNRRSGSDVAQAGGLAGASSKGAGEGCVVGGACVVDVVGFEHRARELLQQVVFFVGGAVGADDADGCAAARVANLFELAGGEADRVFPGGGFELAVCVADERLRKAVGAVNEVEAEAALGAEEVAVDAALVAVVGANDLRAVVGLAHAQGNLAAVSAMGADGGDVVHLPGAGFVAVAAAGERAHGADVDAHAALLAVELVALSRWGR